MTLAEAKEALTAVEPRLASETFVIAHRFCRDERYLDLALTERARQMARKERVWLSKAYLTAFKNGEYGYSHEQAFSHSGSDGIFLLSRDYKPANSMMKKLFTGFIDKPDPLALQIAEVLGVAQEELLPVRLVSHHMRLLGLIHRDAERDLLVIVDHDLHN